jgi:Cys-tRNA(Pro)/Cys-tRNA(Cys) deacylase
MTAPVPQKTNATRLLTDMGIRFELRAYEVDEDDLSAETVARKVGLPPEQVWKTLLFRGNKNGLGFAVVAAGTELDPKALAKLTKDRKVDLVPLKEVQPLTGYVRGGVTVFGAKKDHPVFVDEEIELHEIVSVSAGVRGTQILIAPAAYLKAAKATVGPISRPSTR